MGFFLYMYVVFGVMYDKDIDGVLQYLKGEIDYWCVIDLLLLCVVFVEQFEVVLCKVGVEEGFDLSVMWYVLFVEVFCDVLKRVFENDRIVVFGSFYMVVGVLVYCKLQ